MSACYYRLGRHADALKLREETVARMRAKLGPDHLRTLVSMNNLALSYSALGRHADALKLNEETLALRRAKFGPEHFHNLETAANLALCYSTLGRHTDALELGQKTLAPGESHARSGPPVHAQDRANRGPNLQEPRPIQRGRQAL